MNLTSAAFVQLAPPYGQSLKRDKSGTEIAADWLIGIHQKNYPHSEVLVQDCRVPALKPIGVKRIDEMLAKECEAGFMSGNGSSNVQSSQILPAYGRVEVNGFTKLDRNQELARDTPSKDGAGLSDIPPGHLQNLSLKLFEKSSWCSTEDRSVLAHVRRLLEPSAGKVEEYDAPTLSRIMHMRSKETRYDQASPVITHGWLLIGNRGKVHYERQINHGETSRKMMERAKAVLSCERFDPLDRLRIEGGKTVFVHEAVLDHLQREGHDISALDLSHAQIGKDEDVGNAQDELQNPAPPAPGA